MSEDRNPTPPSSERSETKELNDLLNADKVGDTVFSKHWLFTTLMKLIKEVERQSEGKEYLEHDDVVDISDELQNELCEVWDMSMNTDVSQLLHEFKTIDLLTGVIAKTRAPRVTEIAIGTLGNMACNEDICVDMATKDKFIEMALLLLENDDAPILVETTRLLYTCLACAKARGPWVDAIKARETVFINVQFILQSSTNNDLLKNVTEFVDKLLDVDDEMCSEWASEELVMAILEAMKQLGPKPSDALGTCLHILQLLSTSEKGVEVLVNEHSRVVTPLKKFLEQMCDDEIVAIGGYETWMGSALSVLHVIFSSVSSGVQLLFEDSRLFRCILKILEAMHNRLANLKQKMNQHQAADSNKDSHSQDVSDKPTDKNENNCNSDEKNESSSSQSAGTSSANDNSDKEQTSATETADQEPSGDQASHNAPASQDATLQASHDAEHELLVMLVQIIKSFLEDILLGVFKDHTDEQDSAPTIFTYMNDDCNRQRILFMVDILEDVDSLPIGKMKSAAKKFKLDRLYNIIERRESVAS